MVCAVTLAISASTYAFCSSSFASYGRHQVAALGSVNLDEFGAGPP